MIIIIVWFGICCIIGIVQYITKPKPPNDLTLKEYKQYYKSREWQLDNNIDDEVENIHENERIMLLDETIVKYNKLLDNLAEQYNNTLDEKKQSVILSKQIITLEKLNKALEKREKLD